MLSCCDHIEHAIDIHLDEFEEMPVLDELQTTDSKCFFCDRLAQYQLSKSGVKALWD